MRPRTCLAVPTPALLLAAAAAVSGCATDFEDPSIVIDMRMLGARAEPPEVLVPADADPTTFPVPDIQLCALVADPGSSRRLGYELSVCPPSSSRRCDEEGEPVLAFAQGEIDDPDESELPVELCGVLGPSLELVDIVQRAIENDPLSGFSSVGVQVEFRVWPLPGNGENGQLFGSKRAFFGLQIPEERVANTNPSVAQLLISRDPGNAQPSEAFEFGRCADPSITPLTVTSEAEIEILPVEPAGVREDYVLPTFDGGSRSFTENMTYAWFATAGSFGSETTGGPRDPFGNVPHLETQWTAPEVSAPTAVAMWLVQRDERGGQTWYEMCVAVAP